MSSAANPKVLVVDDDPIAVRTVSKAVRHFGHEALTATDGLAAWDMLLAQEIPIVITDWNMPGFDGLDLCRRIREAGFPYYIYVIFITGRGNRSDFLQVLESGADDLLSKPLDNEELRVRLLVAKRIIDLETKLRSMNRSLQQAYANLEVRSLTDPLMGIGNRRAFDEALDRVQQAAEAERGRYSVVMCDFDHFKCYNDTLGHQAGDEILRRGATAIRDTVRASDAAFRYGGEEIVLLLAHEGREGAVRLAERVRRRIEGLDFRLECSEMPFRVTISCGVATYPDDGAVDPRQIVERADQALYLAKRSGRNRVMAADAVGAKDYLPAAAPDDLRKAKGEEEAEPRERSTPIQ